MATRILLTLVFLLGSAGLARAHPHVWIEQTAGPVFEGERLVGVHLVWVFDEMYSAMILEDYTSAKDGKVTPADLKRIEKDAFMNLKNYDWFLETTIDGQKVKPQGVMKFSVSFDAKQRSIYDFTLALPGPTSGGQHKLEYSVFDPDFFIDFGAAKGKPVMPVGADKVSVDCKLDRDLKRNTLYGPVPTDRTTCSWSSP